MSNICTINGLLGEGGGQVLRTSLALSLSLGVPFHMHSIRGNRPKPGLRHQHLACLLAALQICGGSVHGADLGSMEVTFHPDTVRGGEYHFDIGTGGSAALVLQAILPPLLLAKDPSRIRVIGGTHVPLSPCFEFLRDCLFPRLTAMGPKISITMSKVGYMNDGGGILQVDIEPVDNLQPISLDAADPFVCASAVIYAHGLSERDVENEKGILLLPKFAELGLNDESVTVENSSPAGGSGNAVVVITRHEHSKMVFADYGQKGRAPKKVAEIAVRHALDYVKSGCGVDYYLGDQLLVPMALAGKGSFTVTKVTKHLTTCLSVIESFMHCSHSSPSTGDKAVHISMTTEKTPRVFDSCEMPAEEKTRRDNPAPWHQWGSDLVEEDAVQQMRNACSLPNAVRGALMPDAHRGYGLPIGGVLAVKDAVIPYAVGVDIACRMRLTVLDLPVSMLENETRNRLRQALKKETRFGLGAMFCEGERRQHAVMDEDWDSIDILRKNKNKAYKQLGTSGKGNHFVEFGELLLAENCVLGGKELEAGKYLALLSHSGSRGTGESVALFYSGVAMQMHPMLPQDLKHLAWLDLNSSAGMEYWTAMQLMGRYAAANHELIHRHVLQNLGAEALTHVENHHNFAWKETFDGEDVIIHRKGATPADCGIEGVIPGSMGSSGFVVRGKGCKASLNSCSHGAGRLMSRAAAFQTCKRQEVLDYLRGQGVELISGQIDEAPMVYKDIHTVMAAQADLVNAVARFDPKMVIMAPAEGGKKRRKEESLSTWA